MANKKISEFTALTTPDNADLFAIVDVSVSETKKITWANLLAAMPFGYGNILSNGSVNFTGQETFAAGLKTTAQDAIHISAYGGSAGQTGELRFYQQSGGGTNYVGFKAQDGPFGTNTIWVLPPSDGTANQILRTDGSKNLGWADPPLATTPSAPEKGVQYNSSGNFSANGDGWFIWTENTDDSYQLRLKNNNGMTFPSYAFVDAPTRGLYLEDNILGIATDAKPLLINDDSGTEGQVLTSHGAGSAPTWESLDFYEDHAIDTYSGTIDFNSTDPSSLTSAQYAWSRIGNTVTLFISAFYGTPGTTNTTATITLPTDCPTPAVFAGAGDAASEYAYPISGARVEANMTGNPSAIRGGLRQNASNTGWEIALIFGSVSAAQIQVTISYRIS